MGRWRKIVGEILAPATYLPPMSPIEITMALMRSVVERTQVKLPLGPGEHEVEALKRAIPDKPVLLSIEGSRKEYPK